MKIKFNTEMSPKIKTETHFFVSFPMYHCHLKRRDCFAPMICYYAHEASNISPVASGTLYLNLKISHERLMTTDQPF